VRGALAAAVDQGSSLAIQVRAKGATDRELLSLTCRVLDLARPAGVPVIVDDRVDVAAAAGADGVHLGVHDLPVAAARRLVGDSMVVGGTARTPEAAQAAASSGASYLGVGPAFTTTTKDGLPEPLGLQGIEAVARSTPLPVIAIGGVNSLRVPALLKAGAHGVAVVSAVSEAADPRAATTAILRAIQASA
jgi:thiamine-phosphate pyrophosphorylase